MSRAIVESLAAEVPRQQVEENIAWCVKTRMMHDHYSNSLDIWRKVLEYQKEHGLGE